MNNEILIMYKNYIPQNMAEECGNDLNSKMVVDFPIQYHQMPESYENDFDGDVVDIIIGLKDEIAKLIFYDPISSLITDGLKLALLNLLKKLKLHKIIKISGDEQNQKVGKVQLIIKEELCSIEINLTSENNADTNQLIVKELFQYLKSKELAEHKKKKEIEINNPCIKIIFNHKKGIWEHEEKSDFRQKMLEIEKQLNNLSN